MFCFKSIFVFSSGVRFAANNKNKVLESDKKGFSLDILLNPISSIGSENELNMYLSLGYMVRFPRIFCYSLDSTILGGPGTATSRSSPPITSGVFVFRGNRTMYPRISTCSIHSTTN
jgi:hypothetical protein